MEKSAQVFTIIKIEIQGSNFIVLLVILIDSVFRTGKNYYLKYF